MPLDNRSVAMCAAQLVRFKAHLPRRIRCVIGGYCRGFRAIGPGCFKRKVAGRLQRYGQFRKSVLKRLKCAELTVKLFALRKIRHKVA
jgi:hypothetical protein